MDTITSMAGARAMMLREHIRDAHEDAIILHAPDSLIQALRVALDGLEPCLECRDRSRIREWAIRAEELLVEWDAWLCRRAS
jgi:hypothetical protein